jgi:hypothetical protein
MRKTLFGMLIAAASILAVAAPAPAAGYAPRQVYVPPPAYYPPSFQPSCCCPTVRRGLFSSQFSFCGYQSSYYSGYPQFHPYSAPEHYAPQPYPAYPPYSDYQPAYAPQVGVNVGPVEIGVNVRHKPARRHCWRSKGHWVCR